MFIRATKQILNPFAITLVGAYALAAAAGNFLNRMPEIPGTYYQQARRMADFADHSGVIARGRPADLTVVDRDWLDVSPEEVLSSSVLATVVAGRVEYEVDSGI